MALAHITEFRRLGEDKRGRTLPFPHADSSWVNQVKTFTTSSVQSDAFNNGTNLIRVMVTADANFEIGSSPTAVKDVSPKMNADTAEYFAVNPGDKIAFIQST